jgi:hypothetical protein
MRRILLIISLCLLAQFVCSTEQNRIDSFTLFKTLPNSDSYDRVAYSSDQTKIFCFSNDKNTVDVYRTIDYSIISKADAEIKKFTATAIEFFTNSKGEQSYLIAKSPENELYQINLDNVEEDPILLKTFN